MLLWSRLLKVSSRTRGERFTRVDFLWDAGSSDRNSELVSKSLGLCGVVAIGAAPTPLRSTTIVVTNLVYLVKDGDLMITSYKDPLCLR